MSERPFMQLYVSDFIGDTLHLSTEQVGAYLLLLMAMWNAGGSLPDDEVKLARIVRLSVKKWRAVAPDLLSFFERVDGAVRHKRLTKELQKSESKSESRASAGAEGGKAKALKDNEARLANATVLPQHLPDTRSQKEIEPIAQRTIAAPPLDKFDRLLESLLSAAGIQGFREERDTGLVSVGPILALIERGYDLETDILPLIRDKCRNGFKPRTWAYFTEAIIEAAAAKRAIPTKPAAPQFDWRAAVEMFKADGTWSHAWGPKPGERGCRVPAELLARAAA